MPERFRAPADGRPDAAMLAAYRRDGFLVVEDFLTAGQCERAIARAAELVEAFDPATATTIFSAATQSHAADAYFLESADKVRCFFEPEAFDGTGCLARDKALALNKIGHALHDRDPVFDELSRQPRLAALARGLGCAEPLLLQSMYIFKQPFIGEEVGWHQDACFLYTEPVSVTGFWFALEDADRNNGCLEAIAGAHRGPLRQRFRKRGDGFAVEVLDRTPWPRDETVAIEVPRGSLVVLHGLLPHRSAANRSAQSRHAYTLHIVDGRAAYAGDNWLQRSDLRGFDA